MKKRIHKAPSALMGATLTVLAASVLSACGGSSDSGSTTPTTPTIAAGTLLPASGETAAYADTRLQISFDSAPTIGTSGFIYVYRASDNVLVDKISVNAFDSGSYVADATAATPGVTTDTLNKFAGTTTTTKVNGVVTTVNPGDDINSQTTYADVNTEVDAIGGGVTTLKGIARWVFYTPITISGNTATIRLHDGKLQPSTAYYVKMDNGVLNGSVKGTAFAGFSTSTDWAFTTKAQPDATATTAVTVAASGDADFRTVQGALDWMMNNCAGSSTKACNSALIAKNITVKNGTYEEQLWLNGVSNLTITGESRDGVKIQYKNLEEYNPGTGSSLTMAKMLGSTSGLWKPMGEKSGIRPYLGGGRSVFLIEGADLLNFNQFTLQNTNVKIGTVNNQAETIYYNGSGRLSATYMNFLSAQDTILVKGWSWFYKSLIAGNVDFIWGYPYASVIEESEVRTVVDTVDATKGGYVVQARGYYGYPGFVFLNSKLTKGPGVADGSAYLARSGGSACTSGTYTYAKALAYNCDIISYINTTMDSHIAAAGWYTSPIPNLPANSAALNTTYATLWSNYLDIGSTFSTTTKTNSVGTYGVAAANGWFEYNSKTMNGTPILKHGADDAGYSKQMSDRIYQTSYSNRNQILQSYGTNNAGWVPSAPACSTAACATSL